MNRSGFSLLEVILALAILTGAIAVLGELGRLGLHNARIARDTTQAQLLCESKLAEIAAGITVPEPVNGAKFETIVGDGDIAWLYSIETADVDQQGLVAARVTVAQDLPAEKRPVEFSLERWVIDTASTSYTGSTSEESATETETAGGG